jgi:outer membrane receptor protein involved in Fe transport
MPLRFNDSASILALLASSFAGTSCYAQTANGAPDAGASVQLKEVVVTAEKRTENVQKVPISISVLKGSNLDQDTLENLSAVLATVPSVTTIPSFQSGAAQIVVRGVTASGPLFEGSSTVAYYLDSVPFAMIRSSVEPDPDPYDLQRVEVLRGPQGTLYGATALDGVIRVLTNDPDLNEFDFKARSDLSGTEGGGVNKGGDFAVNVPIVEGKLAARAVVGENDWSGWINSRTRRHVNDATIRNYRLKVAAQPIDDLSIILSAWHSSNQYGAPQSADNDNQDLASNPQPVTDTFDAYSAKITYDAKAFSITSMSSYLSYPINDYLDLSVPGFGVNADLNTRFLSQAFAQEVDLSSKDTGPWRWAAGVFYRTDQDKFTQYLNLAPAVFVPQILRYDLADRLNTSAIYGQLTRELFADALELTVGLRYSHDGVTTQPLRQIPGQSTISLAPAGGPNTATTPRVVLTWHANSDLTFYASYSQGFRAGIPQSELVTFVDPNIPAAKPDILTNYEVGSKGSLFDHRVTYDAALYHVYWGAPQALLDIVTQNNIIAPATVNGTSVSGNGFDGSLQAQLLPGLTAGVDFSWNSLHQNHPVYAAGLVLFNAGQRLAFSPQYTGGASVAYAFPLGQHGVLGRFSASANYTSGMAQNELTKSGLVWVQGNSMVNVRASFGIDTPEHWSVNLFADNLGNYRGTPEIYQPTVPTLDLRVRPRTIGLEVNYRYH